MIQKPKMLKEIIIEKEVEIVIDIIKEITKDITIQDIREISNIITSINSEIIRNDFQIIDIV